MAVNTLQIGDEDGEFVGNDNVPYEQHMFRHMAPLSGESADKFLVRLKKKQARHCNFGTALDDNLRDQLIEKLSNIEWKKKLLEARNISLEDAMDKIRLWEQARDQVTEMIRTDVSAMLWELRRHMAKLVSVVERRVTSLMLEIVLRREGSVQNVKNMAISLAVARVDLSSILPRQSLRNSLLFITVV